MTNDETTFQLTEDPVLRMRSRFWRTTEDGNDVLHVETWVDPGYIQHNPMAESGRDAAIGFLEPFLAQHPDANYSIKRIIADGSLVAVHSHGSFAPGDRGIAVVDILRVEGCKVVEHWDVVQPVPEKSANSNGMF